MPALNTLETAPLDFSSDAELQPSIEPRTNFAPAAEVHSDLTAAVKSLIAGYRSNGWRMASLDPLASGARYHSSIAELDPRTYGLSADELISYSIDLTGSVHVLTLSELLGRLRASYCG